MVALFLFLKGMTGALAPFSYLVLYNDTQQKDTQPYDIQLSDSQQNVTSEWHFRMTLQNDTSEWHFRMTLSGITHFSMLTSRLTFNRKFFDYLTQLCDARQNDISKWQSAEWHSVERQIVEWHLGVQPICFVTLIRISQMTRSRMTLPKFFAYFFTKNYHFSRFCLKHLACKLKRLHQNLTFVRNF